MRGCHQCDRVHYHQIFLVPPAGLVQQGPRSRFLWSHQVAPWRFTRPPPAGVFTTPIRIFLLSSANNGRIWSDWTHFCGKRIVLSTSMHLFRNKKWNKFYVSIVTVIYLVFFTAQLSYKFHVYSNFPPSFTECQVHHLTSEPNSPNFDRKQCLSIDKRFEVKHVLALLTPAIGITDHDYPAKKETVPSNHSIIVSSPVVRTLRGPPFEM